MTLYDRYIDEIKNDVTTCLENMNAQPILFIGSGLSKRYFDAPNWEEMLIKLATICPKIDKKFAYYKQMCKSNIEIGQMFSELFREWAWTDGINDFEETLFEASSPSDIYIKYQIKKILEELTPKNINDITNQKYLNEMELLRQIKPHAIITTNYDQFLEVLFPEYTPIIGQKLLKSDVMSIGEIYKIHGCITDPESLVFNKKDYENFTSKKKYLSAKLLTYFAEHPLLFIGYSAEDPNIKSILSDIDEIISPENELIPNIYILEWSKDSQFSTLPSKERLISINNNRSIRIKSICSHNFEWVYETFGKQ